MIVIQGAGRPVLENFLRSLPKRYVSFFNFHLILLAMIRVIIFVHEFLFEKNRFCSFIPISQANNLSQ